MERLSHYVRERETRAHRIVNWKDNYINDYLLYSFRNTEYDRDSFPSELHYHDYYEIVLIEEGDISYVCDSVVYIPERGNIIIIPPGKLHMSKINGDKTVYKRHVFYLYPKAFELMGFESLSVFLNLAEEGQLFVPSSLEIKQRLLELAGELGKALGGDSDELERAWGFGIAIQIFCLLNGMNVYSHGRAKGMPDAVAELQKYIEENYAEIRSVEQIAEHFFYSREYVSRLFRKYFDTTVSDYIHKLRIWQAQRLINGGMAIIDVCFQVGFGSLSTFIRVFRQITGMTPSEYRASLI